MPHPAPRRTPRLAAVAAVALSAAALGAGATALVWDADTDAAPAPAAALTAAAAPADAGAPASDAPAEGEGLPVAVTAVDFSGVYAQRAAGVVSILASGDARGIGGRRGGGVSQGSGVVIDDEGRILTNEHVVSGASSVRVTFSDGDSVEGRILGTDPSTDLAVVDVDVPAAELTVVPIGSSADLVVGEAVMAVGAPFGYQGTATTGVVSGVGRSITSPNGFSVPDAIQTDAAINRGNSGGALLNADGELVGVPTQIADSGVPAFVGVAFAVPSDTATRVIDQILDDGEVDHAWLGVSTASVDETLQGVDGIGAERGALITGLATGGPAERAGLRLGDTPAEGLTGPVCAGGDVVTAVDGEAVVDGQALQLAVAAREPGDEVDLTVAGPDGATRTVAVTLAERPAVAPETRMGCTG